MIKCKNNQCKERFEPRSSAQKFCSVKCRESVYYSAAQGRDWATINRERRKSKAAWRKRVTEERRAAGLCDCGRRPPREGRRTCFECAETDKQYMQRYNRRRKFGLSIEDYQRMLKSQGGRCALCCNLPGKRALAVDHDHTTSKIRALLCASCNVGIGMFQESVERLKEAIAYLERFQP